MRAVKMVHGVRTVSVVWAVTDAMHASFASYVMGLKGVRLAIVLTGDTAVTAVVVIEVIVANWDVRGTGAVKTPRGVRLAWLRVLFQEWRGLRRASRSGR